MLNVVTFGVVALVGVYFIALSVTTFVAPARAASFLLGFARTARTHYLEIALRGLAGAAFVWQGPHMRFGGSFVLVGWVLVITTAGLALVPWRWHRAFAEQMVPYATRHLRLLGLASIVLGGFVLVSLCAGAA